MVQTHQSTSDTKQTDGNHANQSAGEYALTEGVISAPQTLNDNILRLQKTVGNQAVLQMMRQGNIAQEKPKSSSFNPQSLTMASSATASPSSIQRRLSITSADLSGKQDRSGAGKLAPSTFHAVEKALDEYHKVDEDDSSKRKEKLLVVVSKCSTWLLDPSHKKGIDNIKRASLDNLRKEALLELDRIAIIVEIGVPRYLVDKFKDQTVNDFYEIVRTFRVGTGSAALDKFEKHKSVLGDAAGLVESFMKRNQIDKIDPSLAASMNSSSFKMTSTNGNLQAIDLVKKQAQEKLDRLAQLELKYTKARADYNADVAKGKKVAEADLSADQKAMFDEAEEKGYSPTPLQIRDYPILVSGTPIGKEYKTLKDGKAHYEEIISGKSVANKKKDKEFSQFNDTELYGLMGYTSNLYGAINNPLRHDVGDKTKFTDGHMALAGSITSALHKLKPYKGTVYRHGGDFPGYASVNVNGAIVSDMAPLSTAVDQKGPANAAEKHEVLEILTSKTGRDVSKASVFGSKEGEVLFAPGTRFKVVAAFDRPEVFWDKDNDRKQWEVKDQQKNKYFKQAMAAVDVDAKNKQFHRVVIKEEV